MGNGNEIRTPKNMKKSPDTATIVRRSPRLMGKFRFPFSYSSANPISLSDDEGEMPRDETPVRVETVIKVDNMDVEV